MCLLPPQLLYMCNKFFSLVSTAFKKNNVTQVNTFKHVLNTQPLFSLFIVFPRLR